MKVFLSCFNLEKLHENMLIAHDLVISNQWNRSLWSQNWYIKTKFQFGDYVLWFLRVVSKHHNFKDTELIERRLTTQKTNKTNGKLMDENKQSNFRMSFSFLTRGHVFSQSYSVHRRMSVESVIKKLQKITRKKKNIES
jgi:hypothetical protein